MASNSLEAIFFGSMHDRKQKHPRAAGVLMGEGEVLEANRFALGTLVAVSPGKFDLVDVDFCAGVRTVFGEHHSCGFEVEVKHQGLYALVSALFDVDAGVHVQNVILKGVYFEGGAQDVLGQGKFLLTGFEIHHFKEEVKVF